MVKCVIKIKKIKNPVPVKKIFNDRKKFVKPRVVTMKKKPGLK